MTRESKSGEKRSPCFLKNGREKECSRGDTECPFWCCLWAWRDGCRYRVGSVADELASERKKQSRKEGSVRWNAIRLRWKSVDRGACKGGQKQDDLDGSVIGYGTNLVRPRRSMRRRENTQTHRGKAETCLWESEPSSLNSPPSSGRPSPPTLSFPTYCSRSRCPRSRSSGSSPTSVGRPQTCAVPPPLADPSRPSATCAASDPPTSLTATPLTGSR